MFGLTKREQQQAAWEREAALVVPAMVELAKAAFLAGSKPVDCRTCAHYDYAKGDGTYCYADICTNADRYDPLPVLQLWGKT